VDWPSNLNPNEHDDIPSQSTLPLAKAIENLKSTVNNGQFTVKLLKEGVSINLRSNQIVCVEGGGWYFLLGKILKLLTKKHC
jgi:hypothetical protein